MNSYLFTGYLLVQQVEMILEEGIIDPNAQDCLGRTALHYAVKGGLYFNPSNICSNSKDLKLRNT